MEKGKLRFLAFYFLGFMMALTSCGGGGGGGDNPPPPDPPSISNLTYSPTSANLNSGGGTATVNGTIDFVDEGGNLSTLTISVFNSAGNQVSTSSSPIPGIGGLKSGRINGTIIVSTATPGDFTFKAYVTDAKDSKSNTLTGSFSVTPPAVGETPTIFNLTYSPQSANLNSGGGTVTLSSTVNFTDSGGNLSSMTLTVFDFVGIQVQTGTVPISGAGTSGSVTGNFSVPTTKAGNLTFQVYVTDAYGFKSNILTGSFSIKKDVWTTKAPMPTPRWSLAAATVNGKIYAIGGWGGTQSLNKVEEYDPATNTWATRTPMTTPRHSLGASAVNGKIYVIGGIEMGVGYTVTNKVEEYDPATDTWTIKTPMPTARYGLAVATVNGKIYAIGGAGGSQVGDLNTVEEYDPATNTWATKAPMPTARNGLCASVINAKILVNGGTGIGFLYNDAEEYDPTSNTWTTKPSMPTARMNGAAGALSGKIYVIGGLDGIGTQGESISTVEQYDSATNTWTTKTPMPAVRSSLAAEVVNGKIYAIGGDPFPYNKVEEYNPGNDT